MGEENAVRKMLDENAGKRMKDGEGDGPVKRVLRLSDT